MISAAERGVHLAASLLPRSRRDRFREEWLGNLRDARRLGLTRGAVARGALRFALSATGQRASAEEIAMYNPRPAVAMTLIIGLIVAGALLLMSPLMVLTIGLIPVAVGTTTTIAASILTKGHRNRLLVIVPITLTAIAVASEVAAFWIWGVAFGLADANQSTGSSDTYIALSLLVGAAAFLGLIAITVALHLRSRRYPRVQV